jgi:hypothetical protein
MQDAKINKVAMNNNLSCSAEMACRLCRLCQVLQKMEIANELHLLKELFIHLHLKIQFFEPIEESIGKEEKIATSCIKLNRGKD